MDGLTTSIMTEFSALMDVDLAMVSIIQRDYNNPKFVNQDIMKLKLHDIKQRLLNRTKENPLAVCINDIDIATSIYKQLCVEKYDDVLSICVPNGVFKLMTTYQKVGNYHITVLCHSQREYDTIKRFNPEFNIQIGEFGNTKDEDFDVVFVKSLSHLILFKRPLKNKHIFTLGYRYNLEYNKQYKCFVPLPAIAQVFLPENRLGFVNVYDKKEDIRLLVTTQ